MKDWCQEIPLQFQIGKRPNGILGLSTTAFQFDGLVQILNIYAKGIFLSPKPTGLWVRSCWIQSNSFLFDRICWFLAGKSNYPTVQGLCNVSQPNNPTSCSLTLEHLYFHCLLVTKQGTAVSGWNVPQSLDGSECQHTFVGSVSFVFITIEMAPINSGQGQIAKVLANEAMHVTTFVGWQFGFLKRLATLRTPKAYWNVSRPHLQARVLLRKKIGLVDFIWSANVKYRQWNASRWR